MAAPTCLYSDPKKPGDGPRLYLSSNHGWVEDPQKAVEFPSLSTASRNHQVPIGYGPSQPVLAEAIKVHPAIKAVEDFARNLRELAPQSSVTVNQPEDPRAVWLIYVDSPPEKRSLVIQYQYWKGFGPSELAGDDAVLWALRNVEPHACRCECHGSTLGFFHCFGPVCCDEPDVPRTDLDRNVRAVTHG